MSQVPRPVLVAGCPRSGTSPFARWLHACGLQTVSDDRRNERYPSGYFEHRPMLMFHRALERLPRGADHRITTEPYLTREILEIPFVAEMFERAFEPLLDDRVDFLKYPQLALSVEFLFERFPNAHLVALWRNPVETFRSLVTREFPVEMIPASGVKAILLWNVYAHHVTLAKRRWPKRVSVVEIDAFLRDEAAGGALLERIGRSPSTAVPLDQAIDRKLWRTHTSLRWRAYHAAMSLLCRAAKSRLGPQRESLADQRFWLRELRRLSGPEASP